MTTDNPIILLNGRSTLIRIAFLRNTFPVSILTYNTMIILRVQSTSMGKPLRKVQNRKSLNQ